MTALDFHHVNPEDKKLNISRHVHAGRSWLSQGFIDELNKCVLLCKNCHAEVHEL